MPPLRSRRALRSGLYALASLLACALALSAASCSSGSGTGDEGYGWTPPDAGTTATGGAGAQAGQAGHGGTVVQGGAGGGGQGGNAGAAGEGGAGGTSLRVMAANLTSGNAQTYDPGHGIRIFQGLDPDLVLVQEFNYGSNSSTDLRAFVDLAFGPSFRFTRETNASIPNGIISRHPIVASGVWDDPQVTNREFVWARIDLPGSTDLWVVSVHLLTTSNSDRTAETTALINHLSGQVPNGSLLVVGGDLNTATRTEGSVGVLSARLVTGGPYPADGQGDSDTNAPRNEAYDWVLASPQLDTFEVPVRIGSHSFANGLVFDSRVYSPLSDVAPVLQSDSDAVNMQHMAVVRDFELP